MPKGGQFFDCAWNKPAMRIGMDGSVKLKPAERVESYTGIPSMRIEATKPTTSLPIVPLQTKTDTIKVVEDPYYDNLPEIQKDDDLPVNLDQFDDWEVIESILAGEPEPATNGIDEKVIKTFYDQKTIEEQNRLRGQCQNAELVNYYAENKDKINPITTEVFHRTRAVEHGGMSVEEHDRYLKEKDRVLSIYDYNGKLKNRKKNIGGDMREQYFSNIVPLAQQQPTYGYPDGKAPVSAVNLPKSVKPALGGTGITPEQQRRFETGGPGTIPIPTDHGRVYLPADKATMSTVMVNGIPQCAINGVPVTDRHTVHSGGGVTSISQNNAAVFTNAGLPNPMQFIPPVQPAQQQEVYTHTTIETDQWGMPIVKTPGMPKGGNNMNSPMYTRNDAAAVNAAYGPIKTVETPPFSILNPNVAQRQNATITTPQGQPVARPQVVQQTQPMMQQQQAVVSYDIEAIKDRVKALYDVFMETDMTPEEAKAYNDLVDLLGLGESQSPASEQTNILSSLQEIEKSGVIMRSNDTIQTLYDTAIQLHQMNAASDLRKIHKSIVEQLLALRLLSGSDIGMPDTNRFITGNIGTATSAGNPAYGMNKKPLLRKRSASGGQILGSGFGSLGQRAFTAPNFTNPAQTGTFQQTGVYQQPAQVGTFQAPYQAGFQQTRYQQAPGGYQQVPTTPFASNVYRPQSAQTGVYQQPAQVGTFQQAGIYQAPAQANNLASLAGTSQMPTQSSSAMTMGLTGTFQQRQQVTPNGAAILQPNHTSTQAFQQPGFQQVNPNTARPYMMPDKPQIPDILLGK